MEFWLSVSPASYPCTWPGSCDAPGVECRIEVVHGVHGTVVHLAGRLGDVQVPDFVETCAKATKPLRIDLSELVSVDAAGIEALLRVRDMGAVFDGLPEYPALEDRVAGARAPSGATFAFIARRATHEAERRSSSWPPTS